MSLTPATMEDHLPGLIRRLFTSMHLKDAEHLHGRYFDSEIEEDEIYIKRHVQVFGLTPRQIRKSVEELTTFPGYYPTWGQIFEEYRVLGEQTKPTLLEIVRSMPEFERVYGHLIGSRLRVHDDNHLEIFLEENRGSLGGQVLLESFRQRIIDQSELGFTAYLISVLYDRRIVEVAAGLALPSLFAAHYGANDILATDLDELVLEKARNIAKKAGLADRIGYSPADFRKMGGVLDRLQIENPLIVASLPRDRTTEDYGPFLDFVTERRLPFFILPSQNQQGPLVDLKEKGGYTLTPFSVGIGTSSKSVYFMEPIVRGQ